MRIMVYSLLWVMQDLYHQPYFVYVLLPVSMALQLANGQVLVT